MVAVRKQRYWVTPGSRTCNPGPATPVTFPNRVTAQASVASTWTTVDASTERAMITATAIKP